MQNRQPLRTKPLRIEELVWDGITGVVMVSVAFFVYWWVVIK